MELARCLKVQKTFEVQSREKDMQIQDLLDYKKLWFPEKFLKMESTIKELQSEKNTMKVTYEHKQTMQIEKITAELSRESISLKGELERTKDALKMREAELEPLYQRVEELELMQQANPVAVREVHARYKLLISQLKTENREIQEKFIAQMTKNNTGYQKELIRVEEAYSNKIEWYKANEQAIRQEFKIELAYQLDMHRKEKQKEIDKLTVIANLYKEKLDRKLAELRTLIADFNSEKSKLEAKISTQLNEIEVLKRRIEELEAELAALRNANANVGANLQAEIEKMR